MTRLDTTLSDRPPLPAAVGQLAQKAVAMRVRNRQRLPLDGGADETFYLVKSGVFLVRAAMPGARGQILGILFPGDVVRTQALPAVHGTSLISTVAGAEVLRLRGAAVKALAEADPAVAGFLADRMADHAGRIGFRGFIIAGLTGEERVAALIVEFARRVGTPVAGGLIFDMPLTRTDIADYLALNADTVSRILTRLREKGLVATMGRRRILCRDLSELERCCRVAPILERMLSAPAEAAFHAASLPRGNTHDPND